MSVLTQRKSSTTSRATNFYYSFIFLPREKREAIEAVYAFARRGDDAADSGLAPADAAHEIDLYREALDSCYVENPPASVGDDASLRALAGAIRRFKIPRQYFEDLILGLEMDIRMDGGDLRYETFDDLSVYCYRVAGTIGLIAIEIFGYRDPRAREYALNLGQALQMVNILRDVQSDALRGRVYLPSEDLERFGVTQDGLARGEYTSAFVELMQFESDRARERFGTARSKLAGEDRRSMIAAEIMAAIYWRLLKQIEARAYNVFGKRVSLSRPAKLGTALSVYLGAEWHK
ncbi:MAG TPA: squalene/phytoene synthase family protein [Terriglobia bacterium]|nr:squalene/phytoene synthase family protein [Terriglobia bacterium]